MRVVLLMCILVVVMAIANTFAPLPSTNESACHIRYKKPTPEGMLMLLEVNHAGVKHHCVIYVGGAGAAIYPLKKEVAGDRLRRQEKQQ